jgi:MFS transporter, DHA3 family, macrolide efflux protein
MDAHNDLRPRDDDPRWKARYWTIFSGQIASMLGSAVVQFALIWWLTTTTGSATVLAIASLVGMLPMALLGPLAGVIVDRSNRRMIMAAADAAVALTTLGLIIAFATGTVQVWHVYVAMFLRSAFGAFHAPAFQAATPLLVPESQLMRISGIGQAINGAINIVAPPLGALLIAFAPLQWVLALDVLTAALAVATMLAVRFAEPAARVADDAPRSSMLSDFKEGLAFVRTQPGIQIIMIAGLVINMVLNPVGALMPLLLTGHFGGDAWLLSAAGSVFGVGLIAGGVLLGTWGGFRSRVTTSTLGLFGLAAAVAAVAMAPAGAAWLALIGQGVSGFTQPMINGPLMAIMQARVPSDKLGRVSTLLMSAVVIASPLSLAIAGPISDWVGIRAWFAGSALLTALVALWFGASRAVRALDEGAASTMPDSKVFPLESASAQ